MPRKLTKKFVEKHLGAPEDVDAEIQKMSGNARILSSRQPRLINSHSERWIAVSGGKVRAQAKSFDGLQAKINEKKLQRDRIIVRYIDRNKRALIL